MYSFGDVSSAACTGIIWCGALRTPFSGSRFQSNRLFCILISRAIHVMPVKALSPPSMHVVDIGGNEV